MMLRNVTQGTIMLHSETEGVWRSCLRGGFQKPGGKRVWWRRLQDFTCVP